jgi:tetratricopeptide (TPR) repeat protein
MAVPLAVVAGATGPYDDAKAWALPILAMATLVAWVARGGGRAERSTIVDGPTRVLWWTVVAYAAWWCVPTVTSIAVGLSVLGNFGRGMGLITTASAAALFFIARTECRTPQAASCLVDAALLGSAPVCALALAQAVGWDPLPGAWDPATAQLTIRSTLGQHIFLGSYLAILIPLAAGRLWTLRESGDGSIDQGHTRRLLVFGAAWLAGALAICVAASRWPIAWPALAGWAVVGAVAWTLLARVAGPRSRVATSWAIGTLLGAQVLALVLCGARGPLLGLLFALAVTSLGILLRRRAWRALAASTAALALLGGALALAPAWAPLTSLSRFQTLQRLSQVASADPGTSAWFRLGVWRGILHSWTRQMAGEPVVPGESPLVRSAVGYGLETQLIVLEPMVLSSLGNPVAPGQGWQAQYLVDRAHNVVLDHLVTGGIVGAVLWLALAGGIIAVGFSRTRNAAPTSLAAPVSALTALVAHLSEQQVGIATAAPVALFWLTTGLLSSPAWSSPPGSAEPVHAHTERSHGWTWNEAALVASLAALLVAWFGTRWLLGSVAYAEGSKLELAKDTQAAHESFRRSAQLVPWIPLPAIATAYTALRLAGSEPDPARRRSLLLEGESAIAEARRQAVPDASVWALAAQIAFAEVRGGDRTKLPSAIAAFDNARRLRPKDAQLAAQSGWARLESGDATRAHEIAEQAIALSPNDWLPWALLARTARELGDVPASERASANARRLAPPEAQRLLLQFMP